MLKASKVTLILVLLLRFSGFEGYALQVNAGPEQYLKSYSENFVLHGEIHDQSASEEISYLGWTVVSAAGGRVVTNGSELFVISPGTGNYVFEFCATTSEEVETCDQTEVIVETDGTAPTVDAGTDIFVQLPDDTVTITGVANATDGYIVLYSWVEVSGGRVQMTGEDTATVIIANLTEGVYEFSLTVTDDKQVQSTDSVIVTVHGDPYPPEVSATGPTSVSAPLRQVSLNSSATDSDGNVTSYSWSQLSGPSVTVVTDGSGALVCNPRPGEYSFEVIAYDNDGLASSPATLSLSVSGSMLGFGLAIGQTLLVALGTLAAIVELAVGAETINVLGLFGHLQFLAFTSLLGAELPFDYKVFSDFLSWALLNGISPFSNLVSSSDCGIVRTPTSFLLSCIFYAILILLTSLALQCLASLLLALRHRQNPFKDSKDPLPLYPKLQQALLLFLLPALVLSSGYVLSQTGSKASPTAPSTGRNALAAAAGIFVLCCCIPLILALKIYERVEVIQIMASKVAPEVVVEPTPRTAETIPLSRNSSPREDGKSTPGPDEVLRQKNSAAFGMFFALLKYERKNYLFVVLQIIKIITAAFILGVVNPTDPFVAVVTKLALLLLLSIVHLLHLVFFRPFVNPAENLFALLLIMAELVTYALILALATGTLPSVPGGYVLLGVNNLIMLVVQVACVPRTIARAWTRHSGREPSIKIPIPRRPLIPASPLNSPRLKALFGRSIKPETPDFSTPPTPRTPLVPTRTSSVNLSFSTPIRTPPAAPEPATPSRTLGESSSRNSFGNNTPGFQSNPAEKEPPPLSDADKPKRARPKRSNSRGKRRVGTRELETPETIKEAASGEPAPAFVKGRTYRSRM